jgi:hypothetical protein
MAAAVPTPASQAAVLYALNVADGKKTHGNKGNVPRCNARPV